MKSGEHALWDAHLVKVGAFDRLSTVSGDFIDACTYTVIYAMRGIRRLQQQIRLTQERIDVLGRYK